MEIKKFLWLILFTLSIHLPSYGFYCSKPSEPYCINGGLGLSSGFTQQSINNCIRELGTYADSLNQWVKCKADGAYREAQKEVDEAQKEAVQDYNGAVKRFNCRIEGNSVCF